MRVPSPHTTEYLSLSYTHSYPPPCYRLHCTDEILMVLLGRIMNMLVPGVVCMCVCKGGGAYYTHLQRHATNVHMCKDTVCFSSLFFFSLFMHSFSLSHTSTERSCTDSLTLFILLHTTFRNTHTHMHMPCRLIFNNIKYCY